MSSLCFLFLEDDPDLAEVTEFLLGSEVCFQWKESVYDVDWSFPYRICLVDLSVVQSEKALAFLFENLPEEVDLYVCSGKSVKEIPKAILKFKAYKGFLSKPFETGKIKDLADQCQEK